MWVSIPIKERIKMIYEDICTRQEYELNGIKKVRWLKCGTLKTSDKGNRFIEFNHLPNVSFYVFERKERSATLGVETWLEEGK